MPYKTLFIDLDDTLYAPSSGLWDHVRMRMEQYMQLTLGLPPGEAAILRKSYFETYGTTLRGLQINFNVDTDEFLAYVHDLPLAEFLKPDPALYRLLKSLPQTIWVFTNADVGHAKRVIDILGLDGCFAGIVDVRAMEFHSKPHPRAYELAIKIADVANPGECVLFDDTERNLAPAKALGFFTVQVGPQEGNSNQHIDMSITSLHDIPKRLPELWTLPN